MSDTIFRKMDPAEYHARDEISATMLKRCDPPAMLKHAMDNPAKLSDAMIFGTVVDDLIFGRTSDIIIRPAGLDGRTKEGKEWKRAAELAGKESISQERFDDARRCVDAIWRNSAARIILGEHGESNFACVAPLPALRVSGRCLIDWRPLAADYLADLKTCRAGGGSEREFTRDAIKLGYHIQAAWYLLMHDATRVGDLGRDRFFFIVAESEAPFLTAVYEMSPELIEVGTEIALKRAEMIRDCRETGIWPGYPETGTIRKPGWLTSGGFEFERID